MAMTPPKIRWRVTAIDPGREKLPWCISMGHAACVEDLASCWCPRKLVSPRFECGRARRCCRYSTFLRRRAIRCIPRRLASGFGSRYQGCCFRCLSQRRSGHHNRRLAFPRSTTSSASDASTSTSTSTRCSG
ncbi:unnamed protein product [Ectocarpus sp. 8 AP-2014]